MRVSRGGEESAAQSRPTLRDPMICPWNSLGKKAGVGCHSRLQGIFPTWIKPECPSLQVDSLLSELPGKPKIKF